MSNQPAPTRPWFRLASISRPSPQEPTSTPEPAPTLPRSATIRPAFRLSQPNATTPPPPAGSVSSVPPSPADKKPTVPANAATSSVPSSPVKTVSTTSPAKTTATSSLPSSPAKPLVTNTTAKVSPAKRAPTGTPVASSPTQKPASSVTDTTRMPSPKSSIIKPPTGRPPSPFTLPPFRLKAQAEIDPKKIHAKAEQKTIDKPKGWLFGGIGKAPSKESEAKGKKYYSDSEDAEMRIITITGDNKGAFMEINQSPHHKNGFQGRSSEASDRKTNAKSKSSKTIPMNAFVNSNVQGINNSIVYNSSCAYHDPGVHLTIYTKPTVGGFHVE